MKYLPDSARRVVVKIGTNSLTEADGTLLPGQLENIATGVAALRKHGLEVVLVSSGAVGLGMRHFSLAKRPTDLAALQACAAMGQGILIEAWRQAFEKHHIPAAQILLTRDDTRSRKRSVAVRQTIEHLLQLGAVPIINENDTVSADEIKFGDNDVLSALCGILLDADLLILLSTIPGLLDRKNGDRLIPLVDAITPEIEALAGGTTSPTATGGMSTKLEAARLMTSSGCGCFIGNAADREILKELISGRANGTFFLPGAESLAARKRWLAYFAESKGKLTLDPGAEQALKGTGSSLLAKGIVRMEGTFPHGSVVDLLTPSGTSFARGICSFSSKEIEGILGFSSEEILRLYPGRKRLEVVHRDNLALLRS